jgi:peptidoglycan/xylan/chitin deacetylase (PgdA/CDA1 family)
MMIHDRMVSVIHNGSRFLYPAGRRRKRGVLVLGVLATMLAAILAALLARPERGIAAGQPSLAWAFSPASNTVTLRLVPAPGSASRQVLADSRVTVIAAGNGQTRHWSTDAGVLRVRVPPGGKTRLAVLVSGPQPLRRTLTVVAPSALRVAMSRASGLLLLSASSPLSVSLPRHPLCGSDQVTFLAPSQVAVSEGAVACQARLRLTARDGETAVVTVAIPAQPQDRLYCFASPAGRAVYITVDDGWFPDPQALAFIRRYRLPVTAFLIQRAAQEHLSYWRAFVQAGGTIGDHTVSHPNLTTLTLGQAVAQWAGARRALAAWLGTAPVLGRPPYGDFNPMVEEAAARAGLTALVGWSATVVGNSVETWDGRPLRPGEIVILHWVLGLGRQLSTLLTVIRAEHLHPAPLTSASFLGIAPQIRSLGGD